MIVVSILGILLFTAAILWVELRNCKQKKSRKVVTGITLLSAALAITLLFNPHLPGPTQLMSVMFGRFDKTLG
ncbi:hypothetical protein DFQ01_10649 [Paenibacillus cellulosilyticus]|uniref:Uncharacterized protein n=1 Tax=Paenibacillus cellulosilyticus TaxID=375489 RepID=A0A2V2YUQ6_9BACL|nr:hypothetical protein [Paenibacillus cellulosilyticus]PWW04766.1 hypothetical protein DFQ01_10649 [Paenibacillus cellulosilyticus]QKS45889.1 hypothetical protein HUB94_16645 [Paenibacillus cellulosilyticus]